MNEAKDSWLAGKLFQPWGESRQQWRGILYSWGKCFQQPASWTGEPWRLLIPSPTRWLPHMVLPSESVPSHGMCPIHPGTRMDEPQWTRQTNQQTLHPLNGAHTTEEGALAESDTWETRNGTLGASTAVSKGGGGHKRWQCRFLAVVCDSATQTPGFPEAMHVSAFSPSSGRIWPEQSVIQDRHLDGNEWPEQNEKGTQKTWPAAARGCQRVMCQLEPAFPRTSAVHQYVQGAFQGNCFALINNQVREKVKSGFTVPYANEVVFFF